ncbi:MAG: cyclic nucleotide-binding domain-containing protein [Candidatus Cloacimonetes bacterium]|nr:cyclic nucleotide-binding domain-containing protein [Candidatus Cloacimonadota bacterium]
MLHILRHVDFFADLKEAELQNIAGYIQEVTFSADEQIFCEGEQGNCFYIIAQGRVEIMKQIREDLDEQAELKTFERYDYFGEMSLLENTVRSASAKSLTDTALLRLYKDDFLQVCLEHPHILFCLIQTISARLRHSNEQFARVVNSLIKKNKMAAIGSAAAKIVHDIKNPITVTILTAQLVESLHPETGKYMQKIIKQTETLNDMVREILDFARGEHICLDIQPNLMDDFLQDITESLEPLAKDLNVMLNTDNRVEAPVPFDARRMRRVVINIVRNAMEAMSEPGGIRIETDIEDDHCRLSIIDCGPGIPEDLLATIFEPFVTRGKKSGTGLGLAISQKIVADHNGRIKASNWENGARFDIWLPLNP